MPPEDEIFAKIEASVRSVLNTREGEVKRSSLLVADLGAESIDLLDLGYELEKHFDREVDLGALGEGQYDMRIEDIVRYLGDASE